MFHPLCFQQVLLSIVTGRSHLFISLAYPLGCYKCSHMGQHMGENIGEFHEFEEQIHAL